MDEGHKNEGGERKTGKKEEEREEGKEEGMI